VADLVRLERRENVAVLTLNRPEVLNALNAAVLRALLEQCEVIARSPEVRGVVVTGAGKAFAAGADIEEMRGMSPGEAQTFSRLGHAAFSALEELAVPTLAAVNGFALGGGCELALACDWIYAARRARFGQPEVKLGLVPGFGGTSRLPRRVGLAWAKELVLSGDPVGAETAVRIGLANRVCEPDQDVVEVAVESARNVASRGPLAVAEAKRLIQEGQGADVRVAHALEQAAFAGVFASQDREEGIAAFLAKREPVFRGS